MTNDVASRCTHLLRRTFAGRPFLAGMAALLLGATAAPAQTVIENLASTDAASEPFAITQGPDGNKWYTEQNYRRIG